MKLTLLLIPLLFFMTSCSIDWNDEKDTKIAELEKQITELKEENDDGLFEKRQKCLSYKDEIIEDLKEKQIKNGNGLYSLEQIFYSIPKQDCYFVSVNEENGRTERWLYKYGNHSWHSDSEYLCNYYYKDDFTKVDNGCTEFDAKIQELKGE